MEIQGKVIVILPEQATQGGKVKHGFVIDTGGQYPQKIAFEVWNDSSWERMNIAVGSVVNVSFDIHGREWNGKYFVSLTAWKAVVTDGVKPAQSGSSQSSQQPDAPF